MIKPIALSWVEGNKPLGEVHRHPPNLLNLCIEGPNVLEPDVVVPKAWKPVFNKSACTCPDLPSPETMHMVFCLVKATPPHDMVHGHPPEAHVVMKAQ